MKFKYLIIFNGKWVRYCVLCMWMGKENLFLNLFWSIHARFSVSLMQSFNFNPEKFQVVLIYKIIDFKGI